MASSKPPKVTIVVPVYADWPSLNKCIQSLKKYVKSEDGQIILVNDCGPDADQIERNIKLSLQRTKNFSYFRNDKSLGFIGTCNRAVAELDKTDNDILLLNSDTEATGGFLDEMKSVMYSGEKIGAVSPRSNNATICTLPLAAMKQKGIAKKKSYELFKKYAPKFPEYSVVPTAHGFCILIRRTLIKKYGLFDKVFGKGYGEEVDFCQRIQKHGWLCVISNRSYVFHLEAKSFSMESKIKMLEKNNKIIHSRYPDYSKRVRDYTNDALIKETAILGNYERPNTAGPRNKFKNLIKSNKRIYKIVRTVKDSLGV